MKKIFLLAFMGLFVSFASAQSAQSKEKQVDNKDQGRKIEIKIADLDKAITDYVTINYSSYKIIKAVKKENEGKMVTKVVITNDREVFKLMFADDNKFLKAEKVETNQQSDKTK